MIPDPLIHIRHGETDWNRAKRLQGWRDIPLNDTGRAQAKANGERMKSVLAGMGIAPDSFHWVASPLSRSRETMEIVRREIGLDPKAYRTDDRLREISYGELEGMTHEEIEAERPDLYHLLRTEKWSFLPPGGENYPHLAARVGNALSEIAGPAIVVAHGGVFRAIKSLIEDGPKDGIEEFFVPQDKVFVLENGREEWR